MPPARSFKLPYMRGGGWIENNEDTCAGVLQHSKTPGSSTKPHSIVPRKCFSSFLQNVSQFYWNFTLSGWEKNQVIFFETPPPP